MSETLKYLEINWTDKEIKNLARTIEWTLKLIAQNPNLFQKTNQGNNLHRAVILKHNSLFFRKKKNQIEIISFFSNRKKPRDF